MFIAQKEIIAKCNWVNGGTLKIKLKPKLHLIVKISNSIFQILVENKI